MRIAVARLDLPLFVREVVAQVQLIVAVAGFLRKHRLKRADVGPNPAPTGIEVQGAALLQEPRRRVKRPEQREGKLGEPVQPP